MSAQALLDLSGLKCPEVVLRVQERASTMAAGDQLRVISTDPLSVIDIALYTRKRGHALEQPPAPAGQFHFLLTLG